MIQRHTRTSIAAAVVFGFGIAVPAAFAQTLAPAEPPATAQASPVPAQPDTGPAPSDSELEHFVHAALDVQKIGQDAQSEFQAAKSDQERTRIQQVTAKKMESVVRDNQLSVQRYQQIAMAAQTDQQVRRKINALLQRNGR